MLFLKPTSSYLENGGTIEVPHPLNSLDHEVELAVVIGKKARDVPENTAMNYVGGNFESFLSDQDRHIWFQFQFFSWYNFGWVFTKLCLVLFSRVKGNALGMISTR